MAHFSDDQNYDEFMNASSDEWSKPETPPEEVTPPPVEPTDRWGSPMPEKIPPKETVQRESTFPKEPITAYETEKPKSGSKWWVILIVILVVLCLCACAVLVGLPLLGINLGLDWLQF
jgi:hypothetical protein